MSSISIRRPHALSQKQAVEVANQVATDLASEYGIKTEWSGKTACVTGKGLRGELRVEPKCFELDLELGFLLSMFSEKISTGIEAEFDRLLGSSTKSPRKK